MTSIIVRYLAQDDPLQAAMAVRLIEGDCNETRPGFVTLVALVELVWVLGDCCETAKSEIISIVQRILRTRQLAVEQAETVWTALRLFESSPADFADCLIDRVGAGHACGFTATFDKGAAKAGMRLIG